MVIEDLDLIVRRFGPLASQGSDKQGNFALLEIKHEHSRMPYAQQETFKLIHHLLRMADPDKSHYQGFYLVGWFDGFVFVNGTRLNMEQFKSFLMGKMTISSMFDERPTGDAP